MSATMMPDDTLTLVLTPEECEWIVRALSDEIFLVRSLSDKIEHRTTYRETSSDALVQLRSKFERHL